MGGRETPRGHVLKCRSWQHQHHMRVSQEEHAIAHGSFTQIRNILIRDAGHKIVNVSVLDSWTRDGPLRGLL